MRRSCLTGEHWNECIEPDAEHVARMHVVEQSSQRLAALISRNRRR
jgi:hypothetical protein